MLKMLQCCFVCILTFTITTHSFAVYEGYRKNLRWKKTATDGNVGSEHGRSITLTWGFAKDGTQTYYKGKPTRTSVIIAAMDDKLGSGPGGSDLTERPWFKLFDNSFKRWSQLTGINFVYVPYDDGGRHGYRGLPGELNKRADIRIAGAKIGPNGGNVAYSYHANHGDMFINHNWSSRWKLFDPTKPIRKTNPVNFNNTILHELGHGIGLTHISSKDTQQLMETRGEKNFFGPQLDEILLAQRLYGDKYEKLGGNDTIESAQKIENLPVGKTWYIGKHAHRQRNHLITPKESDFVSIDDDSDTDVYQFDIKSSSTIDITLKPAGYKYYRRVGGGGGTAPQSIVDMRKFSDLGFQVIDADGNILETINANGKGRTESINNFALNSPSTYYVSVFGLDDDAQFYSLKLKVKHDPRPRHQLNSLPRR
ncbi:pre-peptidase C-terminal domain-containing protein [Poriferisphaera sp. WC338]|uniref:pre-peptidase C-terminal domain-containing protein n=1 Tax=Poriferisphaera sp. WC338 TaxID=3425129 RepID=UPI003D81BA83